MTGKQNTHKLVRIDQVMQLYTRLPLAAAVSLILATMLLFTQRPVIKDFILFGWWGLLVGVTALRLLLVFRFRRAAATPVDIETWATRFLIGTVCAGLAWGAGGFFLFHEQGLTRQLVLIFTMSGLASAAVTTLGAVWKNISIFLCTMLSPIILRFFLVGGGIYLVMAVMTLIYLLALLLIARNMHNSILEVLTLRTADIQQEAKLLESEEKYRNVVERSNDGIGIIRDGQLEYLNERLAGIAGYTAEEISGTPFSDYIHPDELPIVVDRYKRRMAGEDVPAIYETVIKHKNGRKVNIEINVGIILYHNKPAELVIVRDITERKQAEEALRESEDRYRDLFSHASDYIFIVDPTNEDSPVIVDANEYACTKHGYTRDELIGQPYSIINDMDTREDITDKALRILAGEILNFESVHVRKDGSKFPVEVSARLIKIKEKPTMIAIVRDITERKQAEEALKESEEKFRNFIETSADLVFLLNRTGYIQYVSPMVKNLYGYSPDELIGKHLSTTTPLKEVPKALKALKTVLNGKSLRNFEVNQKTKNGKIVRMEVNALPVEKFGKIVGLQGIMRDITERKHMEEQIRASLKEKEVLLKEIHHRVKNNLQVVSSLLSLQSRYTEDKEVDEVFRNSQERIRAMAIAHEKLYQSEDLTRIDIHDYIGSLTTYLFESYSFSPGQLEIKTQIEDIFMNLETAIPLGLVINELVSNSLKHGFPDGKKGEIHVHLRENKDRNYDYKLIIRDSGVGLPEGFDFKKCETLGIVLVNTLVKQLKGIIAYESKDGTSFTIKFKQLKH